MKTNVIILVLCFWYLPDLKAQIVNSEYGFQFGTNINLNYNLGKKCFSRNFPGVKVFVGAFLQNKLKFIVSEKSENNHGLFTISTCVSLYNKSLGNSLNLLHQDNQVDWTSSLSLGWVRNEQIYVKSLQSINNSPFYNLRHRYEYAAITGVNFIMNSSRRHQTNGFISGTIQNVSFNYYNDGGSLINLGFGDMFDRWWTGGIGFYFHNRRGFNTLEVQFDQFTGYSKQLFDLSEIFGLDITSYDIYESVNNDKPGYSINPKGPYGYNFNSSQLQVRAFFDHSYGANIGILGSLRDEKNRRYYALQDIIHILRKNPVHPNKDINRLFWGVSYYNYFKNQN